MHPQQHHLVEVCALHVLLVKSVSGVFVSSAPRWLYSEKSPETNKSTLAEYCQSLINLPPHISRCRHLTNFLRVRPEDENPPAPNTSVYHTIYYNNSITYCKWGLYIIYFQVKIKLELIIMADLLTDKWNVIIFSSDSKETRHLWSPGSWREATHLVRVTLNCFAKFTTWLKPFFLPPSFFTLLKDVFILLPS